MTPNSTSSLRSISEEGLKGERLYAITGGRGDGYLGKKATPALTQPKEAELLGSAVFAVALRPYRDRPSRPLSSALNREKSE